MLTQERYNAILKELADHGAVTVQHLVEKLQISESTVRRDLISLDRLGKIIKVHGGATLPEKDFIAAEPDVSTKSQLNVDEKDRIAKYAAAQIEDSDFIYIDAGTTTERMIDYIAPTGATFVTNGVPHAKKLIQNGLKAYIVGGQLKLSTEAVVGTVAVNTVRGYNFTKAFLGTNGISIDRGFTTPDAEEALLKSEAAKRAFVTFILADSSKFGKVSAVTFEAIDRACIITDSVPEEKYKKATVTKEVPK